MPARASGFIPFSKVEKQEDGSVVVYGIATDETLDADGQISDLEWSRQAVKRWEEWGNIREMHQASAVGTSIEVIDTGSAIELKSKIVDPVAALKCEEGVYKGYSWGARSVPGNPMKVVKDASAPNGRIVGGEIVEISIVDRPANPSAIMGVAKAIGIPDETDVAKMIAEMTDFYKSHTAEEKGIYAHLSLGADEYGESVVDAIEDLLESLGITGDMITAVQSAEEALGEKGQDTEVDKAQVTAFIKSMSPEELAEAGLVSQSALDELKGFVGEIETLKSQIAEMESKLIPPAFSSKGALTPVANAETAALQSELVMYENLAKSANSNTAEMARVKVEEIRAKLATNEG